MYEESLIITLNNVLWWLNNAANQVAVCVPGIFTCSERTSRVLAHPDVPHCECH